MDTWWIDQPNLLGSCNPTDVDLQELRSDGFGVLISLLCEQEQAPRYDITRAEALGFVRHSIPVRDYHAPKVRQLAQFVKLVAELPSGTNAVVHCEGGNGRTGTFAAAYWVAKGMDAPEAVAEVRRARPRAIDTREQEDVLTDFVSRCRLSYLVDYVALVYHEGRNVRHLLRAHAVEPEPWKCLVALPVNRDKAWAELQGVRGGNAWKVITELVRAFAAALQEGRSSAARGLLEKLSQARHNTGLVTAKVRGLDDALRNARNSVGV